MGGYSFGRMLECHARTGLKTSGRDEGDQAWGDPFPQSQCGVRFGRMATLFCSGSHEKCCENFAWTLCNS